jgi:hypothetical protein
VLTTSLVSESGRYDDVWTPAGFVRESEGFAAGVSVVEKTGGSHGTYEFDRNDAVHFLVDPASEYRLLQTGQTTIESAERIEQAFTLEFDAERETWTTSRSQSTSYLAHIDQTRWEDSDGDGEPDVHGYIQADEQEEYVLPAAGPAGAIAVGQAVGYQSTAGLFTEPDAIQYDLEQIVGEIDLEYITAENPWAEEELPENGPVTTITAGFPSDVAEIKAEDAGFTAIIVELPGEPEPPPFVWDPKKAHSRAGDRFGTDATPQRVNESARQLREGMETTQEILAGSVPQVAQYQALTGQNLIRERQMTAGEQGLEAAGAFGAGVLGVIASKAKLVQKLLTFDQAVDEAADAAKLNKVDNIVDAAAPKVAGIAKAARTVKHHTIPTQILDLLPKKIASDPRIRGVAGAPNRWTIPEDLHKAIHSGRGGGRYNQFFLDKLKANPNPTVDDVLQWRRDAIEAFGLERYRP